MVYCSKTCPMWSKTFASRYINFRAVCSSIHHQCWMKKVIMRCAEVRGYREDFQCRIFLGLHLLTWYWIFETKMQPISGLKGHYAHSKLMLHAVIFWMVIKLRIYPHLCIHSKHPDNHTGSEWDLNRIHICCQCWPVWRSRDIYWYLHIALHHMPVESWARASWRV